MYYFGDKNLLRFKLANLFYVFLDLGGKFNVEI